MNMHKYLETLNNTVFKKYTSVGNEFRNETRKLQREDQQNVTRHCKQNLKAFWNIYTVIKTTRLSVTEVSVAGWAWSTHT